jgi:hypothetical protein
MIHLLMKFKIFCPHFCLNVINIPYVKGLNTFFFTEKSAGKQKEGLLSSRFALGIACKERKSIKWNRLCESETNILVKKGLVSNE